jgi:hypothetical protein
MWKKSRFILMYYPGVCLDKLMTATKNFKIAGPSTENRSRSPLEANYPLAALSILKQNRNRRNLCRYAHIEPLLRMWWSLIWSRIFSPSIEHRLISVLTRARHWSLFRACWILPRPHTLFKKICFNIIQPPRHRRAPWWMCSYHGYKYEDTVFRVAAPPASTRSLLGLFFYHEDGGDVFLRNIALPPNYMTLQSRRPYSWSTIMY